jgi:hypothetical protein
VTLILDLVFGAWLTWVTSSVFLVARLCAWCTEPALHRR